MVSIYAYVWAVQWGLGKLPGTTPQKRPLQIHTSSYQMSIAPQLEVGAYVPLPTSWWNVDVDTGQASRAVPECNSPTMLRRHLGPSPSCLYLFVFPSPFPEPWGQSVWCRGPIHAWIFNKHSVLCTLTSCSLGVNQIHCTTLLMRTKSGGCRDMCLEGSLTPCPFSKITAVLSFTHQTCERPATGS